MKRTTCRCDVGGRRTESRGPRPAAPVKRTTRSHYDAGGHGTWSSRERTTVKRTTRSHDAGGRRMEEEEEEGTVKRRAPRGPADAGLRTLLDRRRRSAGGDHCGPWEGRAARLRTRRPRWLTR